MDEQQGMLQGNDPAIIAENVKTLKRQGLNEADAVTLAMKFPVAMTDEVAHQFAQRVAHNQIGSPESTGNPTTDAIHQALARLFGRGATPQGSAINSFNSPDDVAMSLRPRVANAGKDINLPKEKK